MSKEGFDSFITQVRGIPWSFGWGICFPLVWIHSIGVFAVACFPVTIFEDAEYSGYRLHYRAICLALALLTLSLSERLAFYRLL